MKVSVVICTHNPDPDRLARVFNALAAQTFPMDQWECLVIDNASEPPLAAGLQLVWHPSARVVVETELGLTKARLRGILEARGELVVFVDDDCVLDAHYLEEAVRVLDAHPSIGLLGGYGQAEYEAAPPEWMNPTFKRFHLDILPPASATGLIYASVRKLGPWVPIGAGMVVRRALAVRYADFIRHDKQALALDRSGTLLTGGGDTDMAIFVMDQGMAVGNAERLRFVHVVPKHRVALKYMLNLLYSSQYSVARLLVYRQWEKAKPQMRQTWRQKVRRMLRVFRRYTPEELCWQAFMKGYKDGLAGLSPDIRFLRP